MMKMVVMMILKSIIINIIIIIIWFLFSVTTTLTVDPACYSGGRDPGHPCYPEPPRFVTRYFFEPTDQQCWPFYYFGCGGNANNFFTLAQCEKACLSGSLLSLNFISLNNERLNSLCLMLCLSVILLSVEVYKINLV